jgi:5'-deoxynucleotidase YfbR-like HD superfamily hydrolase
MAEITRYSSWPTQHKETVAEHSWFVCLLAWAIAKEIGLDDEQVGVILCRAVAHDLDESITGDFIRSFKYSSIPLKQAIKANAEVGMTKVTEDLPYSIRASWWRYWHEAKNNDIEGQVINLADLWSVIIFARREFMLGNNYGLALLRECSSWIMAHSWMDELKALVNDVCAEAQLVYSAGPQRCHTMAAMNAGELTDPFFAMSEEAKRGGEGE